MTNIATWDEIPTLIFDEMRISNVIRDIWDHEEYLSYEEFVEMMEND